MIEFLEVAQRLLITLWLGGLAAIDFVEAPARFRATGVDRNQITAIGRSVFKFFNRYETALGLLSLGVSLTDPILHIVLAAILLIAVLVQFFTLRPQMSRLGEQLDFVNRDPNDLRYGQLRRLHNIYVLVDVAKLALLLWLFFGN